MDRSHLLVAAALVGTAGLAGAWFSARPPAPVPMVVERGPAAEGGGIMVHVSGEVRVPGLVRLPEGARVGEAVAAAGGVTPLADLSSVNLAAPLADGQQVAVPGRGRSDPGPAAGSGVGRVRLNSATAAELEALPGVGPVLAGRIVAHREAHGPFASVEDLLDVPGIGEAKLAALRDLVAP